MDFLRIAATGDPLLAPCSAMASRLSSPLSRRSVSMGKMEWYFWMRVSTMSMMHSLSSGLGP